MNNQTAIIKLLPSLEIAVCINELLRELQSRGDHLWIMRTVTCLWTMWSTTKLKISTERNAEMLRITCIAFSRWCEYVEEF